MKGNEAAKYIDDNYPPSDRLAAVLLNKASNTVIQRIASAEKFATPDVQAWLTHQNADGFDIYISMNALRNDARTRTKADVIAIRHVYLDFDDNGTAAVEGLLHRPDLPRPNYLVSTSPGKWQVVWKVEGFTPRQAEELQKGLSRRTGADIAATDCARVLRLPGFYNHKYAPAHLVRAESLMRETYRPEHFPQIPPQEQASREPAKESAPIRARKPGHLSQSERDWAYAKRCLARGESPALISAAIASYRRFDKANPAYYAEQTVKKALDSAERESCRRTVIELGR